MDRIKSICIEEELCQSHDGSLEQIFLFKQSIFDNIRMGNPNATKEQVISASKAAQCHDFNATKEQVYKAAKVAYCDEFVRNLPNGYDTILGENGSTLSGGERQRISIARALLKDPLLPTS